MLSNPGARTRPENGFGFAILGGGLLADFLVHRGRFVHIHLLKRDIIHREGGGGKTIVSPGHVDQEAVGMAGMKIVEAVIKTLEIELSLPIGE